MINTSIDKERFELALQAAFSREKGMHGSVGTQNEKLIHSTLKNYYAPFSDEQEIKIGGYFADAVNENGIFEIQSKNLYRLRDKVKTFAEHARVTAVHPVIRESRTLFINEDSGEVVKLSPIRKTRSLLNVFEELYSVRDILTLDNFTVTLALLKTEKRVYFKDKLPDMRNRSARKKCRIENVPVELLGEILLETPRDYETFIPDGLPETFTKKELSKAAKESAISKRTEVLREVGVIEKIGKNGNAFVYSLKLRRTDGQVYCR